MTILNKEKILEQAKAFIDEGKLDRAIREYEKIILADPGDLRVKLRIAELFTKRKQITEAIRIYREVADAYAAEGFFLKAVTVHKNILRLNPALTEINQQLADIYEKMGLVADAIRQYDILASALDQKGLVDRALEIRNKIVNLNPSDGSARIRLAEVYQREGKIDEAIDQYEEYAKRLEKSGADKAKLADVFEKILTHRPARSDMFRKLIGLCDQMGDTKKMLKWLEAGKSLVERNPELLGLLARLYAAQNQNETAKTKYMHLADLYRELGDVNGALNAYFEILVLLPDEEDRLMNHVEELRPGALADLANRAARRRKEIEEEDIRREVAAQNEKAQGSEPPQKGREPVEETAADLVEEKPARAKQNPATKAATRPKRSDADALFNLGMVYQKTGLADEARSEFEKAKAIYESCLEVSAADEEIEKRIEEINAIIGGAVSEKTSEAKSRNKKKKG